MPDSVKYFRMNWKLNQKSILLTVVDSTTTSREEKVLAYEYAMVCKVKYPEKLNIWKMAIEDRALNLRQPEPTSLAGATSFNGKNVGGHTIETYGWSGVDIDPKTVKNPGRKGKKTNRKNDFYRKGSYCNNGIHS